MNEIEKQIKENYVLFKKIEHVTEKIEIENSNKRDMLFIGYYRTALSHSYAITLLVEKRVYHSAFSLLRIMFDSVVRGLYLYHILSDSEIDTMYDGEMNFKKMETMCKKLDNIYGESIFEDIRCRVYGNMCDYTHTGINQIARNFNEEKYAVESNFSNGLILDTLTSVYSFVKLFSAMYLEQLISPEDTATIEKIENL